MWADELDGLEASSDSKRVSVHCNGDYLAGAKQNGDEGRTLDVQPQWTVHDLLNAATHRLDLVPGASRVFNVDGDDVEDVMMIEDGEMLFLSAGADFLAPSAVLSTLAEQKDGGGHHHGRADGSKADSKDGAHLPHTIGGYRVGILLGKGGFGEVRVGEHQITHEQVALKFLPKMEILNMGAAERTTTEIQCLCALKHGHIIRLVQQLESSSHIVLAFELMQGGDLLQYLMTELARPQLPEDEARAVFHQASALHAVTSSASLRHDTPAFSRRNQVVSAVGYAHNQHICHRDLKLENILLGSEGRVGGARARREGIQRT